MKSTAAAIEDALANYRKVPAERNKRSLEVYIDAIMKAEFTDEGIREETSDKEWAEEQLGAVGDLVGWDLKELGMSSPADLLDRFDELATELRLDGTTGGDLDPEERATIAAAYFDALDAALKKKAPESVKEIISVPEEFRVLARHVTQINGSMLPDDMTKYAMAFWQGGPVEHYLRPAGRITRPEEEEFPWKIDGEVALLWDPGVVSEGEFICLYSQDPDGTWAWNFGFRWQGGEWIFDNIPELFEWYLWFQGDSLPNIQGLAAEDVLNRAL